MNKISNCSFIFCTIPSSHCFFAYNKFYWVYSLFKIFEIILYKSFMLRSLFIINIIIFLVLFVNVSAPEH